jgi:hypothetical protein
MFIEVDRKIQGSHVFVKVATSKDPHFLPKLAKRIQGAYFNYREAKLRLTRAASDLRLFDGTLFSATEEDIELALAEELEAVLPQEWKVESKRVKALDVQRSELAEIVAHQVLVEIFNTSVPASRIKHKEIPDQPTRGADLIGVDLSDNGSPPRLILGEVKGSCDAKSPPGVVSGMVTKLTQLSTDRRILLQELIWLRDNCEDGYEAVCANLCVTFQFKRPIDIVLSPILLRTAGTSQSADPGIFITDPGSFNYDIRFISVIIDAEDLFDFAVEVYGKARELDEHER